jgi:integrase
VTILKEASFPKILEQWCLSSFAVIRYNSLRSVGLSVGLRFREDRKMGKLTELSIKSKKRTTGDGDGLRLIVRPSGAKSWELRYQMNGRRRDMGLGSYPEITLKEARQKAADARRLMAGRKDPIEARDAAKKIAKPLPTFRDIAALVIADAQGKSVNAKVRYQWERHLGPTYSGPLLDRLVHEITTVDVAAVLAPIWRAKPEVARKTYPAIRRVFDRARIILRDEHGIVMGSNPALWSDLKALGFEAPRELTRGRHPSLPYDEMSNFMTALRGRDAVTARALEFLILTNVRTDAVLKATWDQIDVDAAIWTVPVASLKDRKHRSEPFRVPLPPSAVEIVRDMQKVRLSNYVFSGTGSGQRLSNMALLTLLKRMNSGTRKWLDKDGRPVTAHGFRSTFRTWAEEVATVPHAVVEQAMGHQVGGKVERAYRRTDLLEKRRELMDAWARYCAPPEAESNVTPMRWTAGGARETRG